MENNNRPEETGFNPASVVEASQNAVQENLESAHPEEKGTQPSLPETNTNLYPENGKAPEGTGIFPVRRAGFWMRFWAYILDLIVVGSIVRLIISPIFNLLDISSSGGLFSAKTIASAVIFYLYFVLMTKYLRQTLGKMAFGLAVIDLKDGQLSWQDVLIREWIGRFISKSILVLYLIPAFHPQKKALHDIFADTAVIHVER